MSVWRTGVHVDDVERYPLFTPGLIGTMRRFLPPERRTAVARAVVFTARKMMR